MILLIMKNISVSLVAHFSTVGVAQFCIVGNTGRRLADLRLDFFQTVDHPSAFAIC